MLSFKTMPKLNKCALCSKLNVVIFFGIIRKRKKHECSKEKPKKMRKKQQPKNGKNGQFNKTGNFTVIASIKPNYLDVAHVVNACF